MAAPATEARSIIKSKTYALIEKNHDVRSLSAGSAVFYEPFADNGCTVQGHIILVNTLEKFLGIPVTIWDKKYIADGRLDACRLNLLSQVALMPCFSLEDLDALVPKLVLDSAFQEEVKSAGWAILIRFVLEEPVSKPTKTGVVFDTHCRKPQMKKYFLDNYKPPVDTEPVDPEPVDTEPVETEPVETEPVDTEPVETKPVETKPINDFDEMD
jgi:hypothetical protein